MALNLNRSRSENDVNCTSPYFRRSVIDEIYRPHDNDNSLIRCCSQIIENGSQTTIQTSYQVIHKNRCLSEINLEKYASVKAITPNYSDKGFNDWSQYFPDNLLNENLKLEDMPRKLSKMNTSYGNIEGYVRNDIPMEVDHESANDEVDNDYDSTITLNSDNLIQTKVIRKLNNEPKVKELKQGKPKLKIFILSIIVLLIAYYLYLYTKPSEIQQVKEVYSGLENILYQDHVKEITIKNLNILHENTKFKKVLVFVGSTGVGKTYTVNLIRKYFPKKYIVDINFLLDTHLNIDNIKASLRSDGCYFVTIDDLKITNLEDVISYINQLPEKCMLIIPIFNIHDVDENFIYTVNYDYFERIKQEFVTKLPSNSDVVLFNNINRDNLEIWLRDQMHERDVSKEEAIISLLDEHDVHIYGFKGLSAKINLIDI